jgi:hypothetical protein
MVTAGQEHNRQLVLHSSKDQALAVDHLNHIMTDLLASDTELPACSWSSAGSRSSPVSPMPDRSRTILWYSEADILTCRDQPSHQYMAVRHPMVVSSPSLHAIRSQAYGGAFHKYATPCLPRVVYSMVYPLLAPAATCSTYLARIVLLWNTLQLAKAEDTTICSTIVVPQPALLCCRSRAHAMFAAGHMHVKV